MLSKKNIRVLSVFLFCLWTAGYAKAQTPVLNRLKKQFEQTKDIETKKDLILAICERNYSLSTDTQLRYLRIGDQILKGKSDREFFFRLKTLYVNYLGRIGRFDEAIILADSLFDSWGKPKGPITNQIQVQKCRSLIRSNKSGEAIEISFRLLEEAEKEKDTNMVIQSYVLLGWANMEIEKFDEAIKWLEKGVGYTRNEEYFIKHPSLFSNLASCYNNINKIDLAFATVNKGLEYARRGESLTLQANALNIRADIFLKKKNKAAAEKDLEEALKVRETLADPYYVLSDMGQLSYFYASVGEYSKGVQIAQRAIDIATKGKQFQKLMYLYSALAENYRASGQDGKLARTLERILGLKDTINHNNSERAIAELEGKYEYQKHQNTIMQQRYELSKSRFILIGSILLLILSIILFVVIYKNYQHLQRRKLETMLNEQRQLSEEAIITAGEKERKRIAADLHDNLGAHAAAISSNVKYLKEGILNRDELISNLDRNASGMVNHLNDTIWVLKNDRLRLTNLGDRFKLWLQKLLVNYPGVRHHVYEHIENDVELSPNKILHLFLLLKESVNNALKHSRCKDLTVRFISGKEWRIEVEDNGVGFNDDSFNAGDGLRNMKQRALECGWSLALEKAEPHGTKVILRDEATIN